MAYPPSTTYRATSLSEAQYNADIVNLAESMIPANIDDYSTNVAGMQVQTNPGDVGSESLATTLAGEIERIRYQLAAITGGTYWYEPPAISLASVTATFAAATAMLFHQTAAPTGWTKITDTDYHNAALRTVTTSISDPTSVNPSRTGLTTVFAQNNTGSTTLTSSQMPAHTHTIGYAENDAIGKARNASGGTSGTYNSGSAGSSNSHNHSLTMDAKYVDVIVATKD